MHNSAILPFLHKVVSVLFAITQIIRFLSPTFCCCDTTSLYSLYLEFTWCPGLRSTCSRRAENRSAHLFVHSRSVRDWFTAHSRRNPRSSGSTPEVIPRRLRTSLSRATEGRTPVRSNRIVTTGLSDILRESVRSLVKGCEEDNGKPLGRSSPMDFRSGVSEVWRRETTSAKSCGESSQTQEPQPGGGLGVEPSSSDR